MIITRRNCADFCTLRRSPKQSELYLLTSVPRDTVIHRVKI